MIFLFWKEKGDKELQMQYKKKMVKITEKQ